jgi:hypothetical protein
MIRGIGQAEQLEIRWPSFAGADRRNGTGFSTTEASALLMAALFSREQLVDYLTSEINAMADAVLPVGERAGRLKQLETELTEWQRLDVLLVDRAVASGAVDVAHDAQSAPWITLGVAAVTDTAARERAA